MRVRELAERFGVSTVTARNDLQVLEERQLAPGCTAARCRSTRPRRAPLRGGGQPQRRREGGDRPAAAALVAERRDDRRRRRHHRGGLRRRRSSTAPTSPSSPSSPTASRSRCDLEAAHPRFTIVVTGGTLRPKQHSLVEPLAGSMFQSLRVDTVFLGCNGVHVDGGVTNINLPEAVVKRAMIDAARRCVVLADSTQARRPHAGAGVRARRDRRAGHRLRARDEPSHVIAALRRAGGRRHRLLDTVDRADTRIVRARGPVGTGPQHVGGGDNGGGAATTDMERSTRAHAQMGSCRRGRVAGRSGMWQRRRGPQAARAAGRPPRRRRGRPPPPRTATAQRRPGVERRRRRDPLAHPSRQRRRGRGLRRHQRRHRRRQRRRVSA